MVAEGMPNKVIYPTQLLTTVNQRVRIALPAKGFRRPIVYSIVFPDGASLGAESIATNPLPVTLYAGERINNVGNPNVPVVMAETAEEGSESLSILPLEGVVPASSAGLTFATIFVAGCTDASPSSQPELIPSTKFGAGIGTESTVISVSRSLSFNFNRVVGDPGGAALMQVLFNNEYYDREIYVIVERSNGEIFEGAAIATTGSQSGPVQERITMQVNLQFQGEEFTFTPDPTVIMPRFPETAEQTAGVVDPPEEEVLLAPQMADIPNQTRSADGSTYTYQPTLVNGTTATSWTGFGFPSGSTVNSSTGLVTGVLDTVGTFANATIVASNDAGSDSKQFTLNVDAVVSTVTRFEDLGGGDTGVYILAGQSNAVGENDGAMDDTFGAWARANMTAGHQIVKSAKDGTGFENGAGEWAQRGVGTLADNLAAQIKKYESAGNFFSPIVWVQGERDSNNNNNANAYDTQFIDLKSYISEASGVDLPWLIVKLNASSTTSQKTTTRNKQQALADNNSDIYILNIDDISLEPDGLHYSKANYGIIEGRIRNEIDTVIGLKAYSEVANAASINVAGVLSSYNLTSLQAIPFDWVSNFTTNIVADGVRVNPNNNNASVWGSRTTGNTLVGAPFAMNDGTVVEIDFESESSSNSNNVAIGLIDDNPNVWLDTSNCGIFYAVGADYALTGADQTGPGPLVSGYAANTKMRLRLHRQGETVLMSVSKFDGVGYLETFTHTVPNVPGNLRTSARFFIDAYRASITVSATRRGDVALIPVTSAALAIVHAPMTSANTPSPQVVTASSEYPTRQGWSAMDGSTLVVSGDPVNESIWTSFEDQHINSSVALDIGVAKSVQQVRISAAATSAGFIANRYPRSLKIQYSNNGSNWLDAHNETNISGWNVGDTRIYDFPARVARHWRVLITSVQGSSKWADLAEVGYYGIN